MRVHDRRVLMATVAVVLLALAGVVYVVWPHHPPRASLAPAIAHPGHAAVTGPPVPAASSPGSSPPGSRSVFGLATDVMNEFGVRGVRGYAFVVSTRNGVSALLTDYDLIVNSYLAGQRTVYLQRDEQTYTARVIAVSPDPHVALLSLVGTWDPLPLARTMPAPGDPVTVGRYTAQGPQRAALIDYPGPGAATHLTFSVEVPVAEAGAPVLNEAGQVIGIAEPTMPYGPAATGVGFAMPIDAVCAAIDAPPNAVVSSQSARHPGCNQRA